MVASDVLNIRAHQALQRVQDMIEEHGTPEQVARLSSMTASAAPPPPRMAAEFACFQSEAMAVLAEMIGEIKEANRPKRRGRPPKTNGTKEGK